MKSKITGFLTLFLVLSLQFVFAQKTITGVVSDEAGPLPGASVIIKGTKVGVETDFDGKYTIQAKQGEVLVFSYVGLETVTKNVGTENIIDVQMKMDQANVLGEIVVTAQGIKREKKALGYAVSTVNPEDLQQKPEGDISRVLQGKVAGVNITPTGGLAGSGNTVIVRSKLSISGDNQPLYVVDGVPFYSNANSVDNITGEQFTGMSGANSSNRSLDLDPNNIASISVLKGLSATVLYGNEGRNGVILITTKSGNTGSVDKKMEISVGQTTSISQISNLPKFQNNYGQGAALVYNNSYIGNWGPVFDPDRLVAHPYDKAHITSVFPEYAGLTIPYKAVPNNVEDFFQDGLGYTTSINISKGFENSSFNFNYGRVNEDGYVPKNNLLRNSFSLGGTVKLSNKISVNNSFNFVNTSYKTPPIAAGNSWLGAQSSIFSRLLYIPRNLDLMNLPYQNPITGESIFYRTDLDNPRWLLDNTGTEQNTNRFFGKISFDYNLSDKMNLNYKFGLDQINEKETNFSNKGGVSSTREGFLRNTTGNTKTFDHSLIFTLKNIQILDNLGFNLISGANYNNYNYKISGISSVKQVLYGILKQWNYTSHDQISYEQDSYNMGVYSQAEFDYNKYLYLTLAARNDWTSTLETGNNSLFYPSVSLALIPTDMFKEMKSDFLSFLKIRGGYATSAGFPSPYNTRTSAYINPNAWLNNGSEDIISQSFSSQGENRDLRPELHNEIEVGLESKLFKSKLDIDLSLYKRISKDQILQQNIDPAHGATYKYVNAGRVDTKGVELGLKYKVFNNENFKWDLNTNFNAYESTVIKLIEGQKKIGIAGYSNLGNYAIEGEPFGVIIGSFPLKDENGNLLINNTNGKVINSYDAGLDDEIIGDPNPDFTINLINSVSFKNFSLGFQIDYSHGGDFYSLTASHLMRRGVTEYNVENREGYVVLSGVLATPDGEVIRDGNGNPIPNNIPITVNNMYFTNVVDNDEANIYDATVIRLREVSLSYDLPSKSLEKTPFGSLSFALVGQNLFFDAINVPNAFNIDPEIISTGSGNGQGLEFQSAPSSKKYGFSIKFSF